MGPGVTLWKVNGPVAVPCALAVVENASITTATAATIIVRTCCRYMIRSFMKMGVFVASSAIRRHTFQDAGGEE
jgi:hypothetical protein